MKTIETLESWTKHGWIVKHENQFYDLCYTQNEFIYNILYHSKRKFFHLKLIHNNKELKNLLFSETDYQWSSLYDPQLFITLLTAIEADLYRKAIELDYWLKVKGYEVEKKIFKDGFTLNVVHPSLKEGYQITGSFETNVIEVNQCETTIEMFKEQVISDIKEVINQLNRTINQNGYARG